MTKLTVKTRVEENRAENFVSWINLKEDYQAEISDKNRFNGVLAGSKEFPEIEWTNLWNDFYSYIPSILSVNNICVMTELVPAGNHNEKRIYQVVSRYNYTPKNINWMTGDILFVSDDLESAVNKAVEIGYFNHDIKICCSLSLTGRKECIENNIKMFGDK